MEPIKGLNKVIFLLLSLLGYYMHHIKINKLLQSIYICIFHMNKYYR
jgi:hypothetical protein